MVKKVRTDRVLRYFHLTCWMVVNPDFVMKLWSSYLEKYLNLWTPVCPSCSPVTSWLPHPRCGCSKGWCGSDSSTPSEIASTSPHFGSGSLLCLVGCTYFYGLQVFPRSQRKILNAFCSDLVAGFIAYWCTEDEMGQLFERSQHELSDSLGLKAVHTLIYSREPKFSLARCFHWAFCRGSSEELDRLF